MSEIENESMSVIRRRSTSYTTHYCNASQFHYSKPPEDMGDGDVVVLDGLFRSHMDGEPFQITYGDDGMVKESPHAVMLEEIVLVGLAMPKTTLVRIARSALETFTDAVILTGEEADAYRRDAGDDSSCPE